MRKSTKVFLFIGSLPVIIGGISLILGMAVTVLGCRQGICKIILEASLVLHWFILLGILYTLPASFAAALAYNFIFDKLSARDAASVPLSSENVPAPQVPGSVVRRMFLAGMILVVGCGVPFIIYAKIKDSRSEMRRRGFEKLNLECALVAQAQTDARVCSATGRFDDGSCRRVTVSRSDGLGQRDYYVDGPVYARCLKMKQAALGTSKFKR